MQQTILDPFASIQSESITVLTLKTSYLLFNHLRKMVLKWVIVFVSIFNLSLASNTSSYPDNPSRVYRLIPRVAKPLPKDCPHVGKNDYKEDSEIVRYGIPVMLWDRIKNFKSNSVNTKCLSDIQAVERSMSSGRPNGLRCKF